MGCCNRKNELDEIRRRAALKDKTLKAHWCAAAAADKTPKDVNYQKMPNENLIFWLKFAVKYEFFNYAAELKKEKDRRGL